MTEEELKALEYLICSTLTAQWWDKEYNRLMDEIRDRARPLIDEVRRLQADLAEADAVVAVPWLKVSPYVKPDAVKPQTWRCIQRHRARTGG